MQNTQINLNRADCSQHLPTAFTVNLLILMNKLIKYFILLCVHLPLYCQQSLADTSLYASPEVDITYNRQVANSDDVYAELIQNALDLAQSYRLKILPRIPTDIWTQLRKPKVHISFEDGLPSDGLFIPPDSSWQAAQTSTIKLRIRSDILRDTRRNIILAHEFFHMVHFLLHRGEPSWLREGLAQVFEWSALSGNPSIQVNAANVKAGLTQLSTRLDSEFDLQKINSAQYGHVFLFFYYAYQNCGGESLFWKITRSTSGAFGWRTLEHAMIDNPKSECKNLQTLITDFEIARVHNQKIHEGQKTSHRYFLFNSISKINQISVLPSLSNDILKLEPNQPLLTSLQEFQKVANPPLANQDGYSIRYLEQSFPYRVFEKLPTPLKTPTSIRVLILKPSTR